MIDLRRIGPIAGGLLGSLLAGMDSRMRDNPCEVNSGPAGSSKLATNREQET
jgi:hypothetical protein